MDSVALWFYEEFERNERVQRSIAQSKADVMSLSDESFVKNFRLSKEAFMYVLNSIVPELRECKRSTATPAIIKLSAALKVLGHGRYQHEIGRDQHVCLAQQTISTCLHEVCCAIEKTLCKKHVVFQMTEPEEREAKGFFYKNFGIPETIGIVDATHIQLKKPVVNEHLFLNRKLKYSVNAMVICDHKMIIRAIDTRFGGSFTDSHVWNTSNERQKLKQRFEDGDEGTRILGDSEYPLEPWLLTPYENAAKNSAEAIFNDRLTKARSIIEPVFSVLKGRFQCLLAEMHYAPEKVVRIINVCCALHNICMAYNVAKPSEILNENINFSHSAVFPVTNLNNTARIIRDEIKNAMT